MYSILIQISERSERSFLNSLLLHPFEIFCHLYLKKSPQLYLTLLIYTRRNNQNMLK